MQDTTIRIAGIELVGGKDPRGQRYIATADLEKLLKWRPESTREKLRSKSLKAFLGKGLTPRKKKT